MIGPIDTMKRWWRHDDAVVSLPDRRPPEDRFTDSHDFPDEPWTKEWEKAGIPPKLNYPCTTLGRLLDQTADRFGDCPALFFENESWTYRQLLVAVNRMAGGLAALGLRRGDRLLMSLPNCPEFYMTFFAAQKLGAVVVNAGPLMGVDDLEKVISMTTPKVVVGLDLLSAGLTRADDSSRVEHWVWVSLRSYQPVLKRLGYQYKLWHGGKRNGHGGQHTTFSDLLAHAPSRPPTVAADPAQTALLQPTGGTTGTLKLAELSHRNLLCNAAQVACWMNVQPAQERILAVLPLFHVYGLTLNLVTGVFAASAMIVTTRFNCEEVLDLIRRHKPTIFPLVPAICDAISNELEKDRDERETGALLSGLRLCISGSAPLPASVAERFERLTGAQIIEGYGLTEAAPVTHANLPGAARAGSIGLPMPGTRVRVVDLDDASHVLGPNTMGEMLISGPQVMRGYFANPEQSRNALITDEQGEVWLRTGDVVRYDDEGYFFVMDRKKDMIIRSGLKIYPAKVERVLQMHKQVADAAVVGRADPAHTEVVVAMVVLKDSGDHDASPHERDKLAHDLQSLCREHLAPYEVPADIRFVEKLPRSALGKLLRRELRDMANHATQEEAV